MIRKSSHLMLLLVCVVAVSGEVKAQQEDTPKPPGESITLEVGDSCQIFRRKTDQPDKQIIEIPGPAKIYYIRRGDKSRDQFQQLPNYELVKAGEDESLLIYYYDGKATKPLEENIAAVQYPTPETPAGGEVQPPLTPENESPSQSPESAKSSNQQDTRKPDITSNTTRVQSNTPPERTKAEKGGYLPIPSLAEKPYSQGKWGSFVELVEVLEEEAPHVLFAKPIQEGKKGIDYYAPRWSPDGSKIAAIEYHTGERSIIKIGEANHFSRPWRDVESGRSSYDSMFTWLSTTSDAYAFSRRPSLHATSYDIYIFDSSQVIQINDTARQGMHKNPDWNGKTNRLVYEHESQLYIVESPATEKRKEKPWIKGTQPAISPEGNRVAYVSQFQNGGGIYLIEPHAEEKERQEVFAQPGKYAERPVWSPDGSKVAFYLRDMNSTQRDISCFRVEPPPYQSLLPQRSEIGKNVAFNETFEGVSLAWAPDSKTLVFFKRGGAYQRLYLLNVEEGTEKEVDFDPTTTHTIGMDVSVYPGVQINEIYGGAKKSYEIAFIASKDGVRGVYVMVLNHF